MTDRFTTQGICCLRSVGRRGVRSLGVVLLPNIAIRPFCSAAFLLSWRPLS